jgi:hypothetical protein
MSEQVEIRVKLPRFVIDVLDGSSMADGICRNELIGTILKEWADKKYYKSSLIMKIAGANPKDAEG